MTVSSVSEQEPPLAAAPEPLIPRCHADIAPPTHLQDIKGINFERITRHDLNNNPPRNPAMLARAETMQRQPLLAHAKLATAPPPPDFLVDVPPAITPQDRYPKEIWKTILAFFFLFGSVCVNMMSLSIVHERLPDRTTTKPLNDFILDNVTARDWGLPASEYIIMTSSTIATLVIVFHKHRFIVARRMFFIIGLLYLYRSVTMFVTVMPVSSATYYCSPKSNGTTLPLLLRRTFYLISGFGLSVNGRHTYCGDYIYSGHTMVLLLSYLIVAEYSPRKLWPLHWALALLAIVGVSLVLLAHAHYTVDVIIAYYVTTRLFWNVHTLLVLPARLGSASQTMAQREWWYPLFAYLERNARGPVPRRYDWPLPWPRADLFARLS